MHEHASKMELGDKETVAICIQASVTCYLHVIHRYTCMVRTIRVWYTKNCTIRVWYVRTIRVWYRTCILSIKSLTRSHVCVLGVRLSATARSHTLVLLMILYKKWPNNKETNNTGKKQNGSFSKQAPGGSVVLTSKNQQTLINYVFFILI